MTPFDKSLYDENKRLKKEIEHKNRLLDILKKHSIIQSVEGMGTEIYSDVIIRITTEDEPDIYEILSWLRGEDV